MANLSKLTSYDKADWYRGQALMNQYPSYAEFLAYLTNPVTVPFGPPSHHRTKPAQYVKTKAEQTQKANEEWKSVKNSGKLGGYKEWFNDHLHSYASYGGSYQSKVILPWWNPYENREWTLKEISAQPSKFIQAEEGRDYNSYYFSQPKSVTRIRGVPHKTTGQPTKKKYLQIKLIRMEM